MEVVCSGYDLEGEGVEDLVGVVVVDAEAVVAEGGDGREGRVWVREVAAVRLLLLPAWLFLNVGCRI